MLTLFTLGLSFFMLSLDRREAKISLPYLLLLLLGELQGFCGYGNKGLVSPRLFARMSTKWTDYFLFFNLAGVTCIRFSVDHFTAHLGRVASPEETVNT